MNTFSSLLLLICSSLFLSSCSSGSKLSLIEPEKPTIEEPKEPNEPEKPKPTIEDKDNEQLVYKNPNEPLNLQIGDKHPTQDGWFFLSAHEFLDRDRRKGNLPVGFPDYDTKFMSRMAKVDNLSCSEVKDGVLHIWAEHIPEGFENGYGETVYYKTGAYRTPVISNPNLWCVFTENMRIEVRYKRSNHVGLNNALWFMGNNDRPWPANGEIDLLENPKKTVNHKAHFTLHSENYYAGNQGGKGSVTSSIELSDMTEWNIYWMEWFPTKIVAGVNGATFFEHTKGDNGVTDWPWSDPEGFFMLITMGLSTDASLWPGAVDPSTWDKDNLPSMWIDWVRVYSNNAYNGPDFAENKFY